MGLFDTIRGAFNPEIIAIYSDLITNHAEAFRRWRGKQIVGTLSEYFDFKPSFADKQYIANHKHEILQFEKIIAEEKAFIARRQQVIEAATKYPTAFRALIKKLSMPSIPGVSATLPGERKSKRTQRLEKENQRVPEFNRPSINLVAALRAFQAIDTNNRTSALHQKRSLQTLKEEEYEKIYQHLSSLPTEEAKLKAKLREEDFLFSFQDNILDSSRRSAFYKQFLKINGKTESDYEYLTTHLTQLDSFIEKEILSQFESLSREFALGVQEYVKSRRYGESDLDIKERTIKDKDRVITLDAAKRKYNELKRKYPKGLPAFEQYNSYDDGKNSAELTLEEVIECEAEIAKFEKYADAHSAFEKWKNEQRDFASISRNLSPQNWGCYFYDIPLMGLKPDGSETSADYRVWQHFYTSFYNVMPGTTISDDFKYLADRASENQGFLTGRKNYIDSVYDTVFDLIIALREKVGDISVVFASNGLDVDKGFIFNHRKFEYLISKLDDADISYYEGDADLFPENIELTKHIIIFELISSNARLRRTVEQIRKQFASEQPLISYISLRKGYDLLEVEKLQAEKEAKKKRIMEENERKAREEEAERKRIREEQERKAREEETKKREIANLKSCVSSWPQPSHSYVDCFSLYYYYPTTCSWDATEDEWDVRNLIWDFKANPNKPQSQFEIKTRHERAMAEVMPDLVRVINHFFGTQKNKLTLVCIPSSKSIVTERRYKDLSSQLCERTGMTNGYDYVKVASDGDAKHLGGTAQAIFSIDDSFFKGKYVILFDDVITSGRSMEKFKKLLENAGATVICGLSIGKTKHERQGLNPIDKI